MQEEARHPPSASTADQRMPPCHGAVGGPTAASTRWGTSSPDHKAQTQAQIKTCSWCFDMCYVIQSTIKTRFSLKRYFVSLDEVLICPHTFVAPHYSSCGGFPSVGCIQIHFILTCSIFSVRKYSVKNEKKIKKGNCCVTAYMQFRNL